MNIDGNPLKSWGVPLTKHLSQAFLFTINKFGALKRLHFTPRWDDGLSRKLVLEIIFLKTSAMNNITWAISLKHCPFVHWLTLYCNRPAGRGWTLQSESPLDIDCFHNTNSAQIKWRVDACMFCSNQARLLSGTAFHNKQRMSLTS